MQSVASKLLLRQAGSICPGEADALLGGVPGLPSILGFIHSCCSPLGQTFPLPPPWSGPFTSNICLLMEPATQLDRRGCPTSLLEICVHCPAEAWVSLSIGQLPTHPLDPTVHMVRLCSGTCQAPPPVKGTCLLPGWMGQRTFPKKANPQV